MYLHLGNERVVNTKNIIGIFDMDTSTVSKFSRDFLNKAQKEGKVINVSYELPKSFVVCKENGEVIVYISQLSSITLQHRLRKKFTF